LENLRRERAERFAGAAPLQNRAKAVFDALGERFAARSHHALNLFINAPIGMDAEADGALSHPETGNGTVMVAGISG
jgi:hypothetical protein